MSILSNVISTIAKPVSIIAPIVGGPAGTAVGAVATAKVKSDAERERREQIEIYNRNRKQQMAEIFLVILRGLPVVGSTRPATAPPNKPVTKLPVGLDKKLLAPESKFPAPPIKASEVPDTLVS